jgi:hypothetical protein
LADVDPTLRQRAMGIATEPGPARNLLAQRIRERMASAPEAVREAYSEAMGPAPNVIETLRGFRQTARENAEIGFGKAFENESPVDVSPVLDAIDEKLSPRHYRSCNARKRFDPRAIASASRRNPRHAHRWQIGGHRSATAA